MSMKRLLCMGLAFALLLSAFGCAPAADADPTGTPGKVEDPFTQPTPTPAPDPTAPPATGAPDQTPTVLNPSASGTPAAEPTEMPEEPLHGLFPEDMGMGFGFGTIEEDAKRGIDVEYVYDEKTDAQYRIYNGGEMRMSVMFDNIRGFETLGVGVLLFLGGVPQPYRVEGETEYSYLHPFYLKNGTYYLDLYFIPVTGQKGDELEMNAHMIGAPEFIPTKAVPSTPPFAYSSNSFGAGSPIIRFNADPPAQELPETVNRILSQTVSYADTTLLDTVSWSAEDLLQRISGKCSTPDLASNGIANRFNISADTPIRLRYEVFGSPYVDYRLVYFLDNVPVAVEPEDLAFIEVESGRKTIVETVIDLSGFNGFSILYPMLVPVNRNLTYDGERQPFTMCWIYSNYSLLLSGAADVQEMLEMNSALVGETP